MTSVIKTTLVTLAALGLGTGIALAQAAPEFTAVDTDGDGNVTIAEVQAAWPEITEERFATADADGSGGLSAEEYATLSAQ